MPLRTLIATDHYHPGACVDAGGEASVVALMVDLIRLLVQAARRVVLPGLNRFGVCRTSAQRFSSFQGVARRDMNDSSKFGLE